LSGGERARLLLAKLFSKPANLLVLDEPTNDLDVETLELLEEVLLTFNGTVLMSVTTGHSSTTWSPAPWSSKVKARCVNTSVVIRTGCVRAVRRACWA
jgi:ABC-type lipoprotein export system ATPase subunit